MEGQDRIWALWSERQMQEVWRPSLGSVFTKSHLSRDAWGFLLARELVLPTASKLGGLRKTRRTPAPSVRSTVMKTADPRPHLGTGELGSLAWMWGRGRGEQGQ